MQDSSLVWLYFVSTLFLYYIFSFYPPYFTGSLRLCVNSVSTHRDATFYFIFIISFHFHFCFAIGPGTCAHALPMDLIIQILLTMLQGLLVDRNSDNHTLYLCCLSVDRASQGMSLCAPCFLPSMGFVS